MDLPSLAEIQAYLQNAKDQYMQSDIPAARMMRGEPANYAETLSNALKETTTNPIGFMGSIHAVPEIEQPFIGYLMKNGQHEIYNHEAAKAADYHHSHLMKNPDAMFDDNALTFVRYQGEPKFTIKGESALDPYHPNSASHIATLANLLKSKGADPSTPFHIEDMALPKTEAPYQGKSIGTLQDWIDMPKNRYAKGGSVDNKPTSFVDPTSPLSVALENWLQGDAPLARIMRGEPANYGEALGNALQASSQDPMAFVGSIKSVKTPFEIAHNIAQKNAVEMLGLHPENTAMDRAKALGFDVDNPMYHGTTKDFPAFDPEKTNDIGFHFGTPEQAENINKVNRGWKEEFTKGDANIFPVYLKTKNALRTGDMSNWYDVPTIMLNEGVLPKDIHEAWRQEGNKNGSIRNWSKLSKKLLQDQGYDSIVYENRIESPTGKPADSTIVLDPKHIRSRFAAFDPAEMESSDLLKAHGGLVYLR